VKLAILLLIIVVTVLFLKLRSAAGQPGSADKKNKLTTKKKPKDATRPKNNPYSAVSIEFDLGACPTVQSISDKFFLAHQAPSIPLSGCTSTACHCKYIHHKGRRHAIRRPQSILTTAAYESTGNQERRTNTGRRKTD
jgi:hypothetical protein